MSLVVSTWDQALFLFRFVKIGPDLKLRCIAVPKSIVVSFRATYVFFF